MIMVRKLVRVKETEFELNTKTRAEWPIVARRALTVAACTSLIPEVVCKASARYR